MSKKPYIIQQGSNNLVIVPTENYEATTPKVKLDNAYHREKVPVQQKCDKVNPGGLSRNSNVLINVKMQQASWAANYLQSIGGTSSKPPRLYQHLTTKSTLLPKENTQPNTYQQKTPLKAHQPDKHDKVHGANASKLATQSNANTRSTQSESNIVAIQTKANIDSRHPDINKVPTNPRATNKEVPKLINNKVDSELKHLQENLKICKETNQKPTNRKPTPPKIKDATQKNDNNASSAQHKADSKSKQQKSNTDSYNQSKALKITTQAKSHKEVTKLKVSKEICKQKHKKESISAKSLMSKKPIIKKEDIVLKQKKNKISEEKTNIKSNYKESKIGHNEASLHKESIKCKSPIKSVVKKISNYHLQDSNNHYYKKSQYNSATGAENTPISDSDADLRSKLKRKYPKNDILIDEESKDDRKQNNKFSAVPKSKGFVPSENLIISFNAESDNEGKVKENTPVKTKKQQTGGNKCKKIKLQINIILQNGNTTDDDSTQSENEEDVENINENTDLSFLDDFNIDEIVESLNDCKSNKPKTNVGVIDKCISKEQIFTETMDTTYEDTKRNVKLSLVENDVDKHKGVLQTTIQNQRTSYLNGEIKIDGNNLVNNENAVIKEEVIDDECNLDLISTKQAADINQHNIAGTSTDNNLILKKEIDHFSDVTEKCIETIPSDKYNIENICFDDDITKKEPKSVSSPIQMTNQVDNYNTNLFGTSNNKPPEVESLELKPNKLLDSETNKDTEDVTLIIESDDEYYIAEVLGQQHLVHKVTVDLTHMKEDNLPHTESEDVVIVDVKKPSVIEVDTEPVLTLDTDYDIGIDFKSSSDSGENKNAASETLATVSESTDKSSEPVETVVDIGKNKLNDGYEQPNTALQIKAEDKSDNSAEITYQNNPALTKLTIVDEKNTDKLETKNGKPKTENAKVQNQDSSKTKDNDQVPSNNNNPMTKNNECIPKHANDSLTKDTLSQRLEARMETYLGEKYHVTELIHRGKYSTLYRCEDKNARKRTIKVIKTECDRYYLGVVKENMLMKLQKGVPEDNLNCVRLINGFSMSGLWCFLMEYYPKNLQEVLNERERSFHIDVVQRLSAQLVSAVTILRNNNIIHSDIKPSHILLNIDETKLKLCGFDQAFYYDNSVLLPNIGTVNYRAPELILGYPADYSIDVWSTALVMYEMATNQKLFPGTYNNDILYKQLCTLGAIPLDMLLYGRFRNSHFVGNAFARIVGLHGEHTQLINIFYKKERIHSVLFKVYYSDWAKEVHFAKRIEDKKNLVAFSRLLKQMLVMHPKNRIAIEFVFANPFMYESFDA